MVLTIGDEDDGSASITLFSKATNRRTQGLTDGRSLGLNQLRFDAVKEHLRGDVVAGNRQLNERVSGEDHQTHFVVDHVVHQLTQHLFGAVQTIRCDILCQHRVRYIQCHDGFDTLPFLRALTLTELRSGGSDDQQRQRHHHEAELNGRSYATRIWHQGFHQHRVTERLQLTSLVAGVGPIGCCKNRYRRQQPKHLYMCKTKHINSL